jgi:hypothetical protein
MGQTVNGTVRFFRVRIVLEEWAPPGREELRGQTVYHTENLKQAQGVFDVMLNHPFCRDNEPVEKDYGGAQDPEKQAKYLTIEDRGSLVRLGRRVHSPEVGGSNPSPCTLSSQPYKEEAKE